MDNPVGIYVISGYLGYLLIAHVAAILHLAGWVTLPVIIGIMIGALIMHLVVWFTVAIG